MDTLVLTVCCKAYDSFCDSMRVCLECGRHDPEMIEVAGKSFAQNLGPTHFNCCHAPKDMGHMFGCPNSIASF